MFGVSVPVVKITYRNLPENDVTRKCRSSAFSQAALKNKHNNVAKTAEIPA
jgi:hypothetical protein